MRNGWSRKSKPRFCKTCSKRIGSHNSELGIEKYIRKLQLAKEVEDAERERQANEKFKQVRRVSKARDHVRGNPGATVSLIEYSDFECPFCKKFHSTATQLVETSAGDVNRVYRYFPLPIHNPSAQRQAEATECANALGGSNAFWGFADAIFARTTSIGKSFSGEQLIQLAKELGLDKDAFQACIQSGRHTARVREEAAEGERIGVTSTPTNILLNNRSC